MHTTRTFWSVARLTVAAAAVLVAAGCSSQHEKNKSAAVDRYHNLRSGLMYSMAQQQFAAGDLEMAQKSVKDALMVDPDHPRLLCLAGRISLEKGQLERAWHLFDLSIQKDARYPEAHYYKGIVDQRWQRNDEALQNYQKAYELELDNAGYLLAMAEMMIATDRTDAALELLTSKLDYFDQNAGLRLAIAQIHTLRNEHAQAAEMYRQASILRPEDHKLQEDLAMGLIAAGQYAEAQDVLVRLMKQSEYAQRADLRRALASTQVKLGRNTEARQTLQDLTAQNAATADDWLQLAELCWGQGDNGGALAAANRAITLEPQRHEGYLLAGMAWQKRARLDHALKMFDRAAELAPDSAMPLILRGVALQKAGKPEAAAVAYHEALRRQPGDERAQKLLRSVAEVDPQRQ